MPITHRPKPQEFAVIDLGSNSFHLIIARVVNGAIQVLGRLKQRVRLADGLDSQAMLSDEAINRGVECLALFAERLRGFKAENVCIVATHTLREANNAEVFLQRAAQVIPYPIEIIAGQEEARLIFMGVAHTQPEKGRKLVIDIGGGSTELAIGENFDPLVLESRRMGCVSFANLYFANGEISAERFQKAHLAAMQKLESLAWEYRLLGWQYALGASGTIKAICDVLAAQGDKTGLISKAQLLNLRQTLLQYSNSRDIDLAGLSEERQPIFLSGIAILLAIFDTLAIKELRRSDGALREGLLYEMEGRLKHQDIRSRTANSLAQHYQIDDAQARRVLSCTDKLYQQWAHLNPKLADGQCYALLQWAAMLHEVGLSINHNNLQRHSAYILQNSNLPGFHQEQQLLLATLVRFHRKGIKLEELPRLNLFKKKHYLPLLQILRLAVLLNQQRQATPDMLDVQLTIEQNHWHLAFPAPLLSDNSLLLLALEKEQNYWQQVESWQLTFSEKD